MITVFFRIIMKIVPIHWPFDSLNIAVCTLTPLVDLLIFFLGFFPKSFFKIVVFPAPAQPIIIPRAW